MVPVDPATIGAVGQTLAALKDIIEALRKKQPEGATAALSLMNQLQQHIDALRTQILQLQRDLLHAEKNSLELNRQLDEQKAWKTRISSLKLFGVAGGAIVYAKDGQPLISVPSVLRGARLFLCNPATLLGTALNVKQFISLSLTSLAQFLCSSVNEVWSLFRVCPDFS